MMEMNENLGWITTMFCLFSQYHCFYLSKMVETFTMTMMSVHTQPSTCACKYACMLFPNMPGSMSLAN